MISEWNKGQNLHYINELLQLCVFQNTMFLASVMEAKHHDLPSTPSGHRGVRPFKPHLAFAWILLDLYYSFITKWGKMDIISQLFTFWKQQESRNKKGLSQCSWWALYWLWVGLSRTWRYIVLTVCEAAIRESLGISDQGPAGLAGGCLCRQV